MNGLIWIGQIVLAGIFITSGTLKLFALKPLMQAIENRTHNRVAMTTFSARIIGLIEVVLGFGVLMPDIYTSDGIAPEFLIVRLCAAGLGILIIGTAIYRMRREENTAFDFALFFLALFVIVGRSPF